MKHSGSANKLRNRLLSILLALMLALGCVGFSLAEPAEEEDEPISNEWLDESFDEVDAFDLGDGEEGNGLPGEGGDVDLPADGDADLPGEGGGDVDLPADGDGDLQVEDPQPVDAEQGGAVVAPEDGGNGTDAPAEGATAGDAEGGEVVEGGEDVEDEDADADGDAEGEEDEDAEDEDGEEDEEDEDGEEELAEDEDAEELTEDALEGEMMPMLAPDDGGAAFELPASVNVAAKEFYTIGCANAEWATKELVFSGYNKKYAVPYVTKDADGKVTAIRIKGVKAKKSTTITIKTKTTNDDGTTTLEQVGDPIKVYVKAAAKSLALSAANVGIVKGDVLELRASIASPKGATTQLKWSIDAGGEEIIAFDEEDEGYRNTFILGNPGTMKIKALKPGTAVVRVTNAAGKLARTCTVTVEADADSVLKSITMPETPSITLGLKETFDLRHAIYGIKLFNEAGEELSTESSDEEGGPHTTNAKLRYASSKTKYVTVSADGLITGKKAGASVVTISSYNGVKKTVKVTVKKKKATSIKMAGQTETVTLGSGTYFKPSVSFSKNGACFLYWESSDPGVFPVTGEDRFTTMGPGGPVTLTVSNKEGTLTQSLTINVVDYDPAIVVTSRDADATVPFSHIREADEPIQVYVKKKAYIKGTLGKLDDNGTPEAWFDDNFEPLEDVVMVKGLSKKVKKLFTASASKNIVTVTGKKKGSNSITLYTRGGMQRVVRVQVLAAPKKITIPEDHPVYMNIGDTWALMGPNPIGGLTYGSSDKKVIDVDNFGLMKAVGEGTATITVQYSKKVKATCKITVGLEIGGDPVTPDTGSTEKVKAIQRRLVELGLLPGTTAEVSGVYDDATKAAVQAFQTYAADHGYGVTAGDGSSVDAKTLAAMDECVGKGIVFDDEGEPNMPDWHIDDDQPISLGDTGEAVKVIQGLLKAYFEDELALTEGEYKEATQQAVQAFQNLNSLEVTGSVDSATFAKLQAAVNNGQTHVMPSDGLFEIDGNRIVKYNGAESDGAVITIPEKSNITGFEVQSIDKDVFKGKTFITGVTFEKASAILLIGDSAFEGCTGLANITIPANVYEIGAAAFKGTAITSVTIPSGVEEIAASTFEDCAELTTVTIPDGVTTIGQAAFKNCAKLATMKAPS
ncbi:MAG: leucine-rich repeat protein [Clostridia bacterium]|nr:leucine-rich repeat protein [Clostridia bacterium]